MSVCERSLPSEITPFTGKSAGTIRFPMNMKITADFLSKAVLEYFIVSQLLSWQGRLNWGNGFFQDCCTDGRQLNLSGPHGVFTVEVLDTDKTKACSIVCTCESMLLIFSMGCKFVNGFQNESTRSAVDFVVFVGACAGPQYSSVCRRSFWDSFDIHLSRLTAAITR